MVKLDRRSTLAGAAASLLAAGRLAAEERNAVEAAAKGEGALALATSVTVPDLPKFLAAFTAKYPYINTSAGLFQGVTATVLARVDAEMQAGRPDFDVLHVANPAAFLDYAKRGLLLPYASPELAAYPASSHNDGLWSTPRAVGVLLATNKNMLAPDKAPTAWRDLLRPEFKDKKLVVQNAASGTWLMAVYVLQQALGPAFMPALAAQSPIIATGSAQQIDMLDRGEALVAAGIDHTVLFTGASQRAGIVPIYPAEGVPVSASPIAILKGAPHPNCARLFIDYMLSKAGQELFDNQVTHNYSLRRDVPTPANQKPLADVKQLTPTDWDDYEKFAAAFPTYYKSLFKR